MDVIQALTPTVVAGAAFFFVIRAIIRADRNERAAISKMDAESDNS